MLDGLLLVVVELVCDVVVEEVVVVELICGDVVEVTVDEGTDGVLFVVGSGSP